MNLNKYGKTGYTKITTSFMNSISVFKQADTSAPKVVDLELVVEQGTASVTRLQGEPAKAPILTRDQSPPMIDTTSVDSWELQRFIPSPGRGPIIADGTAFLYERFGSDTVLLPMVNNEVLRNWREVSIENSYRPEHQYRLSRSDIAVRLGPASNGLVAIGFDSARALQAFLAATPLVSRTLQTRMADCVFMWLRLLDCDCLSAQAAAGGLWVTDGALKVYDRQSDSYCQFPQPSRPCEIDSGSWLARMCAFANHYPPLQTGHGADFGHGPEQRR
jgi:hypothetical protein